MSNIQLLGMKADSTRVKMSVGVTIALLTIASFANIKPATLALRVVIQCLVIGYGIQESYNYQGYLDLFFGILATSGGSYGFYLIYIGSKPFTTLSYIILVGVGIFGSQMPHPSKSADENHRS